MAPNVLASGTGPRMTGSDTVVASVIVPEWPIIGRQRGRSVEPGHGEHHVIVHGQGAEPEPAAVSEYAIR